MVRFRFWRYVCSRRRRQLLVFLCISHSKRVRCVWRRERGHPAGGYTSHCFSNTRNCRINGVSGSKPHAVGFKFSGTVEVSEEVSPVRSTCIDSGKNSDTGQSTSDAAGELVRESWTQTGYLSVCGIGSQGQRRISMGPKCVVVHDLGQIWQSETELLWYQLGHVTSAPRDPESGRRGSAIVEIAKVCFGEFPNFNLTWVPMGEGLSPTAYGLEVKISKS